MKSSNRDLLVLTKYETPDPVAMKREIDFLNNLLFTVENLHTFCIVNEIINVNKYKIIRKPYLIHQIIRERNIKPFVFIFNKN
jgi:hypothetical protein